MISVTGLYSFRGGTWHGLWYQRGAKSGGGTDDNTKELHRHGLSWGGGLVLGDAEGGWLGWV